MADPAPLPKDTHIQTVDPRTGEPLAQATPAATIIVFRDAADGGVPELLMVERSSKMVFAGGAVVFPGGRVDPDDHRLAASLQHGLDPDDAAARIASIRETIEETGLGIGFAVAPEGEALAAARAAMHAGAVFSDLCRDAGWQFDLSALTPFTRWRPPFNESRIFDTRFYLARCGAHDHIVEVDATENRHLFWATAQQALTMADDGKVKLIFPTRRNMERLALFGSHTEAVAHAVRFSARMIMPFIEERDGAPHLCIPDDLGYPVTSEPLGTSMRG
ncbi:NUDIX domain-containing protein [Blastomonas sp. AAP53]|uniref:NUDIX hydrolase n=1 Tax=Blastomonas sp. AAP53 TaxID=1248760 RepID=UPI0002E05A54|nr:NUDIX domain-containing protein [Blastomonas sp. AAP53]